MEIVTIKGGCNFMSRPNALTDVWAHGTSIQYNQKEADLGKIDVSYTPSGIELMRIISNRGKEVLPKSVMNLFLPITIPTRISDAVQHLEGLKIHFTTEDSKAKIIDLRLLKNDSQVFNLTGSVTLNGITGDFMENGLEFDSNSSLFSSLCLQFVIEFEEGTYEKDKIKSVIIASAKIVSKQKKFDYDN